MLKRLFSNEDEQKVLTAIRESGLTTMRVVGRGTLTVNTQEVTNTAKFRRYSELAEAIVQNKNK